MIESQQIIRKYDSEMQVIPKVSQSVIQKPKIDMKRRADIKTVSNPDEKAQIMEFTGKGEKIAEEAYSTNGNDRDKAINSLLNHT